MAQVRRTGTLTQGDLNRATLARQMLLARERVTPRKAIERLCGMQAQEARPPFVGLWSRIQEFDAATLRRAIEKRQIVRATAIRGTLHLLTAKDFVAFRGTLQSMMTRAMLSVLRGRTQGFDVEHVVAAAAEFLGDDARTFEDIRAHLASKHKKADPRAMGYAVRTHLPLVQVPDPGAPWSFGRGAEFACAGAWLGTSIGLSDEALLSMVKRYLAAFGPATPADMQTWSGIAGLTAAFDELRTKLAVFEDEDGRELFDLPRAPRPPAMTKAPVRFLPEFDNLVLAHADRSRFMTDADRKKICTKNLRVQPTFFVDGRAAGLWKVERSKTKATLSIAPFGKLTKASRDRLTAEGEAMLEFSDGAVEKHVVRFG